MDKMKNIFYAIWLIVYVVLSYLYFVERNFAVALLSWIGLLVVATAIKSMRDQAVLLFLIGACFCFMNLLHRLSPWLQCL